jgi:hypothetical protein
MQQGGTSKTLSMRSDNGTPSIPFVGNKVLYPFGTQNYSSHA